jgi:ABC-type transport system involved in multi-copper enzyme maturation permease subunit
MFLRQVSIEIRKTVKHPALWVGLTALLLLLTLFIVIHHSQIKYGFTESDGGLEQDLLEGLSFFNWIGGFVYAVTASVIAAYDYPNLRLWLTRGLPRQTLLLARLMVILLFNGSIILFTIFATLVISTLSRSLFFRTVDVSRLNTAALLPIFLRTFWISLPYLALTILFAIVSRSPIFAGGGMIVYADVLERLLMSMSDRYPLLTHLLPGNLSMALQINYYTIDHTGTRPIFHPPLAAEPQAILIIGILFAVLCAFSFVIFSRQDVGG